MYLPAHFREDRVDVQHGLIGAHPLGTLITHGPGGLMANHVPFLLYPDEGERGTLRAHLARANPQYAELQQGGEVLVVFAGPADYVSPGWYATKRETGKVVPTWNFVAVHVWGSPRLIDDGAWLHRQLEDLTNSHERAQPRPWQVDDAPTDFIAMQKRAIVGLEMPIARSEGKWKLSQNRSETDRRGVLEGLQALGPRGAALAALVAATLPPSD